MASPSLEGTRIADRFAIVGVAGSGGMGTVYQAIDERSGATVAVKVLSGTGRAPHPSEGERFAREARILSELKHPGIVSYIDHGHTELGQPYLVMEWLAGCDLAERLRRDGLSTSESLTLLRRVAEALVVAHRRGITHRDIKPSNLFLRDGSVERAAILDFGVARDALLGTPLTRTESILGTPGYMAPEQARGRRDLGPSADIFSLGCVLFEALTGRPAFTGEHIADLLVKILFEEVPPLRELAPGIPEPLEALVAGMVSKDPAARPADAAALLARLDELGMIPERAAPIAVIVGALPGIEAVEQELVTLIVASPFDGATGELATIRAEELDHARAIHRAVRDALAPFGCRVEGLADGSIVAALTEDRYGAATDLAVQAARCALRLRECWPDARVALATGRSLARDKSPLGDLIDRAGRLLRARIPDNLMGIQANPIRLDELTAGLVDASFEVTRVDAGLAGHFLLSSERATLDETRPLLGKPTPCVGREQELAMLEVALADCIERSIARAVVITAPPGAGKSRLRHELMRRLRAREDVEVLCGRGDPMSAGGSYGLLRQALRRLAGVVDGMDAAVQRARLAARVARSARPEDARRITEFLGELCGVPFPEEDSVMLRTARRDPLVMGDRIREAFVDFLRAESAAAAVLLILEDLHWGDALTVRLVDAALAELSDSPLFVLALARPEVSALFPNLWEPRRRQVIELRGLSRRACERLVAQVLGSRLGPADVARIVEQAAGNALYLEELIRASAESGGLGVSEAILVMLQARLLRLDAKARRVLLAASVFGETFWRGGVLVLLGGGSVSDAVDGLLRALVEAELIELRRDGRLAGEAEYRFRHALMRDAAYSLLTPDDKALGHRAAAAYLEEMGERDAMILAEHLERGGHLERAGEMYLRAARRAHWGGDVVGAIERAERGLRCSASDETRLPLLAIAAELYGWRGDFRAGGSFAEQALRGVAPGGAAFWSAAATKQAAAALHGTPDEQMDVLRRMLETDPLPDAVGASAFALMAASYMLRIGRRMELAEQLVARSHANVEPVIATDPVAHGWMSISLACLNDFGSSSAGAALRWARVAERRFQEAEHKHGALSARLHAGVNLWLLGSLSEAEIELRATLVGGSELGPTSMERYACLIQVLADRGALDEAHRLATSFVEASSRQSPLDHAVASWALAEVLYRRGDLAAEASLAPARPILEPVPLYWVQAAATAAAIELAGGRVAEALSTCESAVGLCDAPRAFGYKASRLLVVYAEALRAAGRLAEAAAVIARVHDHIVSKSKSIDDPEMRRAYLDAVPEHARALTLARAWLSEEPHLELRPPAPPAY